MIDSYKLYFFCVTRLDTSNNINILHNFYSSIKPIILTKHYTRKIYRYKIHKRLLKLLAKFGIVLSTFTLTNCIFTLTLWKPVYITESIRAYIIRCRFYCNQCIYLSSRAHISPSINDQSIRITFPSHKNKTQSFWHYQPVSAFDRNINHEKVFHILNGGNYYLYI